METVIAGYWALIVLLDHNDNFGMYFARAFLGFWIGGSVDDGC